MIRVAAAAVGARTLGPAGRADKRPEAAALFSSRARPYYVVWRRWYVRGNIIVPLARVVGRPTPLVIPRVHAVCPRARGIQSAGRLCALKAEKAAHTYTKHTHTHSHGIVIRRASRRRLVNGSRLWEGGVEGTPDTISTFKLVFHAF